MPAGPVGRRLGHPQLVAHLGTTQAAIGRAIADHHIPQPSRRQQLARQRQRAAQQRATDRVAELGFASVRAYLVDRLVTRAWTLTQVQGELGAAPSTLRHRLDRYQVRRAAPTRRQRARCSGGQRAHKAGAGGPAALPGAGLAALGFTELGDYLQDRYVMRDCSVGRPCTELGVGHGWLDRQLTRLGLRS